ncbi:MAG TPA: hypothetical protein VFZ20_13845, partial [Longimicrobium sp.]
LLPDGERLRIIESLSPAARRKATRHTLDPVALKGLLDGGQLDRAVVEAHTTVKQKSPYITVSHGPRQAGAAGHR